MFLQVKFKLYIYFDIYNMSQQSSPLTPGTTTDPAMSPGKKIGIVLLVILVIVAFGVALTSGSTTTTTSPSPSTGNTPLATLTPPAKQAVVTPTVVTPTPTVVTPPAPVEKSSLIEGEFIKSDSPINYLINPTTKYKLYLQADGNLCYVNVAGAGVWCASSVANPNGPFRLNLQADGNLCIADKNGGNIWCAMSHGTNNPYRLELGGDNNICVYGKTGPATWCSYSHGK